MDQKPTPHTEDELERIQRENDERRRRTERRLKEAEEDECDETGLDQT